MTDIRQWLGALGLGEYADTFEENAIDLRVLPALTEDDLKELGLKLGHRRMLEQAVAELSAESIREQSGRGAGVAASTGRAERRQLTVMFCDLVNSTALAESMDPEDYRKVLSAYQNATRAAIVPYAGYIARYMGDGLLVYFGYPQAHEDDSERAVRAGLEIVEAVRRLEVDLEDGLAVRIGVATGPVVAGDIVGEGASEERAVLGETPNLAARLQGVASPNALVISQVTQRLVAGRFALESLGNLDLKGITEPVAAYRVTSVRTQATRFEAAQLGAMTPLLGRDSELALLEQRWERACAGEGQTVLLEGEPGIGKSRLIQAVRDRLGEAAAVVQRYQCSPYHAATAFYPVVDLIERAGRFSAEDDTEAKLDKIENMVEPLLPRNETAVTLIAALLSLPIDRYAPLKMTAQEQRSKTIDVLVEQLASLEERGPILILFEDLHWSDPSTIEFLDAVIDRMQSLSVLALATYRPEFSPPWTGYGHVTAHSLNRLGRREVDGIVESVTGGKSLPPEVLEQIAAKTDGVPLFIEELTKTILEAGFLAETGQGYILEGPLPPLAIPSTLHDALLARLDRLSQVKEIAQLGACIGREFRYDLLAATSNWKGNELDHALAELARSELVFRRGEPPEARYTFKHALVQDAAYQSLLRRTRQQYHERIARVLASEFPDAADTQPELLAHHYTRAGLSGPAIEYWNKAGQRASERSAHLEAIAHLTHGLDVLQTIPDTPKRAQQELDLQAVLGPAVMVTKGLTAPETERVYERARELCEQVPDSSHRFPVLWGLWYVYLGRGALKTALQRGEELFRVAQELRKPALLIPAHRAVGNTLLWLGEVAPACKHLEDGVALYDPQSHQSLTVQYGQDLSVVCSNWASWARWALGYPEQALKHVEAALARAEEIDHPLSRAYALNALAWTQIWRGDAGAAERSAGAGVELCEEQGFATYLAWLRVTRGAAAAQQGRGPEGISEMRQGIAAWAAMGARVAQPKMLALLGEAYAQIGRPDEGLKCLAEAMTSENGTGERFYHAELHRLQGTLLLESSPDQRDEAEGHIRDALEIARSQQTKSFELRAATSLARHRCEAGRRQEALDLLTPIYDWFTEGFDTRDLREAKTFLDQLK